MTLASRRRVCRGRLARSVPARLATVEVVLEEGPHGLGDRAAMPDRRGVIARRGEGFDAGQSGAVREDAARHGPEGGKGDCLLLS
ncbi:hypothetical protein [Nocardia arizonensis]|uniref:hypothetical protein n=1 Tax=Nocardia arizonensis TaxID=1141647 RepID=UPI0007A75E25|nr:hypothetical protein [Nocardia arizonensis]